MPFPPRMPVTVSAAVRRDDRLLFVRDVSGEPTPDGQETEAAAFLGLAALDELPFDGQNAFLARRILTSQAKVLLPHDNRD